MEENFNSTTINLGGNNPIPPVGNSIPTSNPSIFGNNQTVVSGYVAPVQPVQPAQPVEPVNTTITTTIASTSSEPVVVQANTQITEPIQNMHSQVVDIKLDQKTLVYDKPIIKRDDFKELVNNIDKGRPAEGTSQLANIVQFIFNSEGLELRIANAGVDYISVKTKKDAYKYNLDESFCIDHSALFHLINEIKDEEIEFLIETIKNEENGTERRKISINTETADFYWIEATTNNGTTFDVEMNAIFKNVELHPVPEFKQWTNALKVGTKYVAPNEGDASLAGVLCIGNKIYATDSKVVMVRSNPYYNAKEKLYFTTSAINKMNSIDFGDNVQIGFVYDSDKPYISNVIIKSDIVTFTSSMMDVNYYEGIPVETIETIATQNQDTSLVVPKSKLFDAVKVVCWFIGYADEGRIKMTINSNEILFNDMEKRANYRIPLINNNFSLRPLTLDGGQVKKIVDALDLDTIKIFGTSEGMLFFKNDNDLIVMSEVTDM